MCVSYLDCTLNPLVSQCRDIADRLSGSLIYLHGVLLVLVSPSLFSTLVFIITKKCYQINLRLFSHKIYLCVFVFADTTSCELGFDLCSLEDMS